MIFFVELLYAIENYLQLHEYCLQLSSICLNDTRLRSCDRANNGSDLRGSLLGDCANGAIRVYRQHNSFHWREP